MTPWHLTLCLEAANEKYHAEHNKNAWFMWHGAVLNRIAKVPPLENFEFKAEKFDIKKQVPMIDEAVIIARMKAHNIKVAK